MATHGLESLVEEFAGRFVELGDGRFKLLLGLSQVLALALEELQSLRLLLVFLQRSHVDRAHPLQLVAHLGHFDVQGVRVVSLQGDQAVVEVGGKRRPLRIGQHAGGGGADAGASDESAGESKTTLMADGAGHFFTTGAINGVAVRFLVDTGATFVSIGSSDARRFGIDTARGQTGISHTANGQVKVTKVKLDSVQVGGVTLHNVDAVVHGADLPVTLLGMSFLNRMEMQREGATMTLRKRF
ncbi:MAG: hypothetical protein BWY57_02714 [Betaproteobacteria bacterium ADurb.Bin341]|nr:MAG: hypothetical protein BWY57_02714 [Betaproteobacteria bacterium ADurb.Bin341]